MIKNTILYFQFIDKMVLIFVNKSRGKNDYFFEWSYCLIWLWRPRTTSNYTRKLDSQDILRNGSPDKLWFGTLEWRTGGGRQAGPGKGNTYVFRHSDITLRSDGNWSLSNEGAQWWANYRVFRKIVFFHNSLQPLPRLHRCKRPSKLSTQCECTVIPLRW